MTYIAEAKLKIARWESEKPSWLASIGDSALDRAEKVAAGLIPDAAQQAVANAIEAFLVGVSRSSEKTVDLKGVRNRVATRLEGIRRPSLSKRLQAADQEAESC